jgi:hypothetical protein
VLIVGGRQSAYEWAALLAEHRAERIDLVHRHDVPRFERVSWQFVDPHMEATMRVQGWWRTLPKTEQDAIARQFWEVGRLTLEYWLTPRLASKTVHRWPGTEVVHADTTAAGGELEVRLSKGEGLLVDHVIFACGYRADLPRVPYLAGVLDRIQVSDGFPVLDEAFGTSLPGLYLPGFTATRDLGPFFGSSKPPRPPRRSSSRTSWLDPDNQVPTAPRLRCLPLGPDRRGLDEGLEDRAIPLDLLAERGKLLGGCLGSLDVEDYADVLEPRWHVLGDAERPAQIKVALHRDFDALHRDGQGGRSHLA